jgi:hypothetical protein
LKTLHPEIKVIYLTQNREPRYAVEAVKEWHADIDDRDIGLQLFRSFEERSSVRDPANHVEIRLKEML